MVRCIFNIDFPPAGSTDMDVSDDPLARIDVDQHNVLDASTTAPVGGTGFWLCNLGPSK